MFLYFQLSLGCSLRLQCNKTPDNFVVVECFKAVVYVLRTMPTLGPCPRVFILESRGTVGGRNLDGL